MKYLDVKFSLLVVVAFFLMSWMTNTVNPYYVPTSIDDFFLPGSQPLESGSFTNPNQCDNCHGGYDLAVEPAFTWRGSMMSHSMRDPLFLASMTIANQDALFSGDLCIRCHSPAGWLEGRSTPTDGSALTANDREGVQCHFCHRLIDPLSTTPEDLTYMATISNVPTQHGNGMYVVDNMDIRRGPYDDANAAPHNWIQSSFVSKSEFCATCHDVSNPVYTKAMDGTYQPNNLGESAPSFDTYEMFPVERTYSEWTMSAYNSPGGVPSQVFGGNKANVSSCLDCHMMDVNGKGCNKNNAPTRNDLPLHDLTGGNTFVPLLVKDKFPTEVDANAIDAGIIRAQYMLENAATMNLSGEIAANGYDIEVKIINETGHKLPSGYPEGRRMWINVQAFDINDNLLYESGAYDNATAQLETVGTKIYEAKLGMSQAVADIANSNGSGTYTAGESFHFALNNMVVKDNRIPPRGFTNSNFEVIQAAPVGYSYDDGDYYDETYYNVPGETYRVLVRLMYQTTSKEYIEFLRDNNVTDTKGQELYDLWVTYGKSIPVVMQEVEFLTSTLAMVNKEVHESEIKLFPNPTSSMIHIQYEFQSGKDVIIEIYTMNGVKIGPVFKGQIGPGKQVVDYETSKLASGTYILQSTINGNVVSKLLINK